MSKTISNPVNIQLFAEGNDGNQTAGDVNATHDSGEKNGAANNGTSYTQEQLDNIVSNRVDRAEKAALKSFFEQQGMNAEEITQAVAAYRGSKQERPDTEALQAGLAEARQAVLQGKVENAAILEAVKLGIDASSIPYVLKMADLSTATSDKGEVNKESVQAALNKVLDDVPALKPVKEENKGFRIGATRGQKEPEKDGKVNMREAIAARLQTQIGAKE